jgi:hypothetical protein
MTYCSEKKIILSKILIFCSIYLLKRRNNKIAEKNKSRNSTWEIKNKTETMENFDLEKSKFYHFVQSQDWLGSNKNEIMSLKLWRAISKAFSEKYNIHIPRKNWRYKHALLNGLMITLIYFMKV